jgi:hypothetical protein
MKKIPLFDMKAGFIFIETDIFPITIADQKESMLWQHRYRNIV